MGTLPQDRRNATIEWLLEADNPPVRYLVLRHLLGRREDDPEVLRASACLMDYHVTKGILAHAERIWGQPEGRAYTKYTGKYWQLIFLGHFLADGNDPRIRDGVEQILDGRGWIDHRGLQCLTANVLAALIRIGYAGHPVVMEHVNTLARRVERDRGAECAALSYSLLTRCHMAATKLLLCFLLVPPAARTTTVNAAIDVLVDTLLAHAVYRYVPSRRKEWQQVLSQSPKRADLPPGQTVLSWVGSQKQRFLREDGSGSRTAKQGWIKFGFPLHYNSDILESMYALAAAGVTMTPQLAEPLDIVKQKMTPHGNWIMENSLNGKMWVDVEQKGKPSKWLTYFGLRVTDHFASEQTDEVDCEDH